ncbi:MAG: hypothetical protein EOP46_08270 [Sphingobacteriaceae bacterium]|nr:MAG: hypothetical protein EOP46_08270 [Sphingobacteriaceae bacterium]
MKYTFTCIALLSITLSFNASAQESRIVVRSIGKDSINLPLDINYYLTKETCADIIRYGHFNFEKGIFLGKIKDVSNTNANLILTEGNYNKNGEKDGEFVVYNPKGTLQAKGSFKNNRYTGKWEMYFEDGKPQMVFEVNNDEFTITSIWDERGRKIIDNGVGTYRTVSEEGIILSGKLLNGKPEGKWTLSNATLNRPLVTEYYKKNQFVKGETLMGPYTDKSKLVLIEPNLLKFTRAERMMATSTPCAGSLIQVQSAKYKNGIDAFGDIIARSVTEYLNTVDLSIYNNKMIIEALIYEDGTIKNFKGISAFNNTILRGIIGKLQNLPPLQPATINGKPVQQKFRIEFTFNQGTYNFTFEFLPL